MLTIKISFLIILLFSCFSFSCYSPTSPLNWLPDVDNYSTDIYGSWISFSAVTDSLIIVDGNIINQSSDLKSAAIFQGEFIAIDSQYVYLIPRNCSISKIRKNAIFNVTIEPFHKDDTPLVLWTIIGSISSLSHGIGLVFTFPIWLTTGIAATAVESRRHLQRSKQPDKEWWVSVTGYSRFPTGLPLNVDIFTLKGKSSLPVVVSQPKISVEPDELTQSETMKMGVQAGAVFPQGGWGSYASTCTGGIGTFYYPLNKGLTLTGALGYYSFGSSDEYNYSIIPIVSGLRYSFETKSKNVSPYFGCEIGFHIINMNWRINQRGYSYKCDDSSTKFGFSPMIGGKLNVKKGVAIDMNTKYSIVSDAGHLTFNIGIMFNL